MDSNKITSLLANTGDMALKRRARRILETVYPAPGDRILDIGCGDGYYLHLLSELQVPGVILQGSDFDKDALISARKNLTGKKIKLDFGDLMKKLPYRNNSFNKIVMSEVAEHLPDDLRGLKEVYRVLRPGGILALSVPNANYPFFWDPVNKLLETLFATHIKSGFWAGLWNKHIRLYTCKEIESVIKKAGFSIISIEATTFWCLPFNHYLVNLTARAIHSGKLAADLKSALNKFETKTSKPPLINLAFRIANQVDKLNDIFPVAQSGVGVFVAAKK